MDLDYIDSLAELIGRSRVAAVTVRHGDQSVTLRRRPNGQPTLDLAAAAEPDQEAPPAAPALASRETPALPVPQSEETALVPVAANGHDETERRFEIVKAHRVGIFHRGGSENGSRLVEVGQWYPARMQVGAIESMKLFDEIDLTLSGRIAGVFVEDGAPVEYGQPLFHIEVCDEPVTADKGAEE